MTRPGTVMEVDGARSERFELPRLLVEGVGVDGVGAQVHRVHELVARIDEDAVRVGRILPMVLVALVGGGHARVGLGADRCADGAVRLDRQDHHLARLVIGREAPAGGAVERDVRGSAAVRWALRRLWVANGHGVAAVRAAQRPHALALHADVHHVAGQRELARARRAVRAQGVRALEVEHTTVRG